MLEKAPLYILSAKADDYLGKAGKIDEKLYGMRGIVDKSDDVIEFENLKKQ